MESGKGATIELGTGIMGLGVLYSSDVITRPPCETLRDRCYHLCFTDQKTKAQRG